MQRLVGQYFMYPLKRSLSLYIRTAVSCYQPTGRAAGRAVISNNLDIGFMLTFPLPSQMQFVACGQRESSEMDRI